MAPRRKERGDDGLTDIERCFVAEYLIDLDQSGAMRRADGTGKEKNWRQLGYQMMRRPHVKAAVEAALEKRAEKMELSAEKVLGDIDRIARKAEGSGDLNAALRGRELLGKHLKLFSERVEHSGPGGGPIEATLDVSALSTEALQEIMRARNAAKPG